MLKPKKFQLMWKIYTFPKLFSTDFVLLYIFCRSKFSLWSKKVWALKGYSCMQNKIFYKQMQSDSFLKTIPLTMTKVATAETRTTTL